ncbi:unnamed protein product [Linum trigynum]|uniref:Uncharacterized protein n=1 Tax=Linum trigynum TaxID=586398 RepID=A0AAV2CME9_9ROSI
MTKIDKLIKTILAPDPEEGWAVARGGHPLDPPVVMTNRFVPLLVIGLTRAWLYFEITIMMSLIISTRPKQMVA